jgi:hypothetical protein
MIQWIKYTLIWLAISFVVGAGASYFFGIHIWVAAAIAGIALMANGLLATWEDRGKFND